MKRYTNNEINELANILKKYGICARMNSIKAHDKLVAVKNRPTNKAFPIMCADEEQIKSIAIVDEKTEKLIRQFMPGPITLILKKKPKLAEYINNGKSTIAVRMASSKIIEELIRKIGSPLFMTSANQSGNPPCTTLDEIEKECPNLDGMLGGNISFGKGSTIVDCVTEPIKIVREGPISLEQIEKTIKIKRTRLL